MTDSVLRIPPFAVRLRSDFPSLGAHISRFYGQHPVLGEQTFIDFDLTVRRDRSARRYFRPQAHLVIDGLEPFFPLPAGQAAPLFEWGLNWMVASRPLGYLVVHAAVVARGDAALVLPGFPGAGKSTLCASLVWLAGWRLLSDELAILSPQTSDLVPHPRPISLKNQSIDIVAEFPSVEIGPRFVDTRKGVVSHASVPATSIALAEQTATCRWIVFPRFRVNGDATITSISRSEAFVRISEQSFNKERMGEDGFASLCGMLNSAECFEIQYGSTGAALRLIEQICGK